MGLGRQMIKVVYDVDDVLWPLNKRVFTNLKIDFRKDTCYNLFDNPSLTPGQSQAILDAFHQAKTFIDMNFYPGADEILQAESLGAIVHIHSHCYTAEIAKLKRIQLHHLLPQMKASSIKMSLISTNPNNKQVDTDTYIFIDDNPYNIVNSRAPINIVLQQPWNTTAEAVRVLTSGAKTLVKTDWRTTLPNLISQQQFCVVTAQTLKEVNQIVQYVVKFK